MLILGVFLYLARERGHIFLQTPVLKDCKKKVMCSLSNRVQEALSRPNFSYIWDFFEWGFMLISGFFLYLVGNGGIYSHGLNGILCKHLC